MYIKRFANKHKSSNKYYHNLQNYSSTTHIHRKIQHSVHKTKGGGNVFPALAFSTDNPLRYSIFTV